MAVATSDPPRIGADGSAQGGGCRNHELKTKNVVRVVLERPVQTFEIVRLQRKIVGDGLDVPGREKDRSTHFHLRCQALQLVPSPIEPMPVENEHDSSVFSRAVFNTSDVDVSIKFRLTIRNDLVQNSNFSF